MGDKEFENFMNDEDDLPEGPKPLPYFLVFSLREKMKSIAEMYRTSTDVYMNLDSGESDLKGSMKEFITDLMNSSRNTLNQFDLLMSAEIYNEDPDEDGEDE